MNSAKKEVMVYEEQIQVGEPAIFCGNDDIGAVFRVWAEGECACRDA